jgi:hypothetical protein
MTDPKDALLAGVQILEPALSPKGFTFEFREEGKGSGGYFAWASLFRTTEDLTYISDRASDLVTYHAADQRASHESYMRELGAWEQCHYPGFSDDHINPFLGLAHDLGFAEDFLSGPAAVLGRAAAKQVIAARDSNEEFMAGAVADVRLIEHCVPDFTNKNIVTSSFWRWS